MYCKKCGNIIDNDSSFCRNCGNPISNSPSIDKTNVGFAILGFFIPLVGFILYLVYENKNPNRAKSSGKGALIGFITKMVISVILVILYFVFAFSFFENVYNSIDSKISSIIEITEEETPEMIMDKYVDVSFGEFTVTDNGYDYDTSLNVTVKNKAEKQCTYDITIEAVDANGTRIDTDTIYADQLNPNQKINLTAFEYVEQETIEQYKNATFKVLEIDKYDY